MNIADDSIFDVNKILKINIGNKTLKTIVLAPSFCSGVINPFIHEIKPNKTINKTGNNVDNAVINFSSLTFTSLILFISINISNTYYS